MIKMEKVSKFITIPKVETKEPFNVNVLCKEPIKDLSESVGRWQLYIDTIEVPLGMGSRNTIT